MSELTDDGFWDSYWEERGRTLPLEVRRETASLQAQAILDVIDAHLPAAGSSVLEVGGAPGQYLAYIHRRCSCRCAILDYSASGCALTKANFRALGVDVTVHEADLLATELTDRFDLVYSLGLVEHFADYAAAVAAQARLVTAGGVLLVGMPNFRGVNGWFARHIDRARFESHNLAAMDLTGWNTFEEELGLQRLFRGYVGGFEPAVFATPATSSAAAARLLAFTARTSSRALTYRFAGLRRLNRPWLSGYLMGVWRVPSGGGT
jgi:SAM-dependent methyltransferase